MVREGVSNFYLLIVAALWAVVRIRKWRDRIKIKVTLALEDVRERELVVQVSGTMNLSGRCVPKNVGMATFTIYTHSALCGLKKISCLYGSVNLKSKNKALRARQATLCLLCARRA